MFGMPATDDGEHFEILKRAFEVGRSHLELKEQRAFENDASRLDGQQAQRPRWDHAWSYGVDTISPADTCGDIGKRRRRHSTSLSVQNPNMAPEPFAHGGAGTSEQIRWCSNWHENCALCTARDPSPRNEAHDWLDLGDCDLCGSPVHMCEECEDPRVCFHACGGTRAIEPDGNVTPSVYWSDLSSEGSDRQPPTPPGAYHTDQSTASYYDSEGGVVPAPPHLNMGEVLAFNDGGGSDVVYMVESASVGGSLDQSMRSPSYSQSSEPDSPLPQGHSQWPDLPSSPPVTSSQAGPSSAGTSSAWTSLAAMSPPEFTAPVATYSSNAWYPGMATCANSGNNRHNMIHQPCECGNGDNSSCLNGCGYSYVDHCCGDDSSSDHEVASYPEVIHDARESCACGLLLGHEGPGYNFCGGTKGDTRPPSPPSSPPSSANASPAQSDDEDHVKSSSLSSPTASPVMSSLAAILAACVAVLPRLRYHHLRRRSRPKGTPPTRSPPLSPPESPYASFNTTQGGDHSDEQKTAFTAARPISLGRPETKKTIRDAMPSSAPPPIVPAQVSADAGATKSNISPNRSDAPTRPCSPTAAPASVVHVRVDTWSLTQWMSAADQFEAYQAIRAEQWELGPIVYQQRSVEDRQLLAENFAKRIEAHRMRHKRFTGRFTDELLAEFGAALPVSLWRSSNERTIILPLDEACPYARRRMETISPIPGPAEAPPPNHSSPPSSPPMSPPSSPLRTSLSAAMLPACLSACPPACTTGCGTDTVSPAVSDDEVLPVEGPDRLFGSDAEYAERAEHDKLQAEALANPARRIGTNRSALITQACAVITGQWLDLGAPALGDFWSEEVWDTPARYRYDPLTPPPTPDASRLAKKLALDWFQTSGTNWIPAGVKKEAEIEAQRIVITRGYLCTPGPEGLVLIDNDDTTDASDADEVARRRCQCGFHERNIPEHNGTGFEECTCGLRVPVPLTPQELVDYVDTPEAMRNLSQWAGETGDLAKAAIAADPDRWRVRPPKGSAKRRKRALATAAR